ncbi:MAG: hypothetical protein EOO27_24670 [Comamonadaceae bacterium]|nr:MAG: hypothetical protein EOO27_24670 [Comamonadaceae bacterium]
MRLFELFLRRAGVDRAQAPDRGRAVSRLTVECPRDMLGSVRKQICLDFQAAGLDVSQVQVGASADADMASACITVNCAADSRSTLMAQARRLNDNPAVHRVRFGRRGKASDA